MPSPEGSPNFELRDYMRVLWRRRLVIALSMVVVTSTALAASYLQTNVYQAVAAVLLQRPASDTLFNPNTGQANDPARAELTQIQVLLSRPVRDKVRAQIGIAPNVTVRSVGQTDVIEIKASSTDPNQAAAIANSYANSYIDFRRTQSVNDLLAAVQQIQARIDDLQHQIDPLSAQIDAAPLTQRAAVAAAVAPQRDGLLSQQGVFKQKLGETQVGAALSSGGAQLVTPATVPRTPVSPRPKRDAVIALVVGLVFGVGVAFLFEYLDDSIKSKEDLERAAHGHLPVLGLIPAVASWKNADEPRVVSLLEPNSPSAEAYRTLRTSIQFLGLEHPVRVLQITSPSASEGKTTTLANLAVTLAGAGRQVVISCCDLRRPRMHEFFGLTNTVGFTSVMLGEVSLAAALQQVPEVPGLHVLASGPLPPNPSELLSSPRAQEVLAAMSASFDMLLLDCPPVLPVTDAAVLSARVDATLLVATAGTTTRRELARAVEILRQVDAPLVGAVLNGVAGQDGYGYRYGYGYYASPTNQQPGDERPKRRAVRL